MDNANNRTQGSNFNNALFTEFSNNQSENPQSLVQSAMLFDTVNGLPVPIEGSAASRITPHDRATMREVFSSESGIFHSMRKHGMQLMAVSDILKDKQLMTELSTDEVQWLETINAQLQAILEDRTRTEDLSLLGKQVVNPPTIRLQYHFENTIKCLDFESRVITEGGVLLNDPREITLACKLYKSQSNNKAMVKVADKILELYEERDKLSIQVKKNHIDIANAKRAKNIDKYNKFLNERERLLSLIDQVSVDSAPHINALWKFRECRYYISERHNYGNGNSKIRTPELKTSSEIMDWHLKRNDIQFIEPEDVEALDERICALEKRLESSPIEDKRAKKEAIDRFRDNLNEVTQDYFTDYASINTSIIWQYSHSEKFTVLANEFDRIEEQTLHAINRSSRVGKGHNKGKKGKNNSQRRNQKSSQTKTPIASKTSEKRDAEQCASEKIETHKVQSLSVSVQPKTEHSEQALAAAIIVDLTGTFSKGLQSLPVVSGSPYAAPSTQAFKHLKPKPELLQRSFSQMIEQEWMGSTFGTGQKSFDKHYDKHAKQNVKKEYYFSMSRLFSYVEAANSNNEIRKFRDGNYAFVLKGTIFQAFGGHFSKSHSDERHTYTFYKRGSEKINHNDVDHFRDVLLSFMSTKPNIAQTIMTSSLRQHYDMLFDGKDG